MWNAQHTVHMTGLAPGLWVVICLLATLTGCFRVQETCASTTDCFGDEVCTQGRCVVNLSMITDMASPEQPDMGLNSDDVNITTLQPGMIVSSEVAIPSRFGEFLPAPCHQAVSRDGAVWVGFVEQSSLDLNTFVLFRRSPDTGLWEDKSISRPDEFFGSSDLEPAQDGHVALCIHEQLDSKIDVYKVSEQESQNRWSIPIVNTEETQCHIATFPEGEPLVLYKESQGMGSMSTLMLAERSPDNTPDIQPLDAAFHDTAWPIDLLMDSQTLQPVAFYYGLIGGRPSLRYGEPDDAGVWTFTTHETAFTRVRRHAASALGPQGLLHTVTLEDTVMNGEDVVYLNYLHPEDEELDLVLTFLFFDSELLDLSVDPSGRPHIVFSDGEQRWYGTLINKRWHLYAFPEPVDVLSKCLRVHADDQGRAHILMDNSGWQATSDQLASDLVYRVVDVTGSAQ